MNDNDFDTEHHRPKHGDVLSGWIVFVVLILVVGLAGNLLGN